MRAGDLRRVLGVLALLAALPAAADYKDSYSRGLEAAKDGDWAAVRRYMGEALAEHPEPAARIRLYGQRWEPYVPRYYLGLAAFKTGDCKTALERWKAGEEAGVLQGLSDLRGNLQRDSGACEQRVAQQTPTKPEPTKPDVAPTKPEAEPVKPTPKPEPPKPEPVKPTPKPDTPKPETPKPEAAAARVPQPLLDAFKAYLAGRYDDVVRINADAYAEPRARQQALLIRAAARYTLGELDGNRDTLEAARADIRALQKIDARLQPDAILFSPRFRTFFGEVR